MKHRGVGFLTVALLWTSSARAGDFCYFEDGFYDGTCNSSTGHNSTSGGAYAAFADAFNINPASIPTVPTPIGVEFIASKSSQNLKSEYNFGFIKGFKGAGVGVTSNADETFYVNNLLLGYQNTGLKEVMKEYYVSRDAPQNINFGSAVAIPLGASLQKSAAPTVGAALRYNRTSLQWDTVLGASLNSKIFSLGYSRITEKSSRITSGSSTSTISVGVKFPFFRGDYTYINYSSAVYSQPMRIYTLAFVYSGFTATLAHRDYLNVYGTEVDEAMLAIQYHAGTHLSVGYMNNYLPDAQTLIVQIFF